MPQYIGKDQIWELKKLIQKNKLPKFFELFENYCKEDLNFYRKVYDELVLHERRYSRLQQQIRQNTIDPQIRSIEESKIIEALLSLLNHIPFKVDNVTDVSIF